jgi:hypothetical protein
VGCLPLCALGPSPSHTPWCHGDAPHQHRDSTQPPAVKVGGRCVSRGVGDGDDETAAFDRTGWWDWWDRWYSDGRAAISPSEKGCGGRPGGPAGRGLRGVFIRFSQKRVPAFMVMNRLIVAVACRPVDQAFVRPPRRQRVPVQPHRLGCDGRPSGDDLSQAARGGPAGREHHVGGGPAGRACAPRAGYCRRAADRRPCGGDCCRRMAVGPTAAAAATDELASAWE